MAAPPSDFLEVDNLNRTTRLHRSRSGGYADHMEEISKRDRHNREREMKRYHESRYGYGSSVASQQRASVNRLSVPIFETNTRRNRSTSEAERRRDDPSPGYNVQEVRPSSRPIYDYDDAGRAVESRQKHHKKPSIKVEIHQDNPPSRSIVNPPEKEKRSSSGGSPHSPTGQPQLAYQYTTLQTKLQQVITICGPYLKVEAANPDDLTFSKISEQVRSFAFELRVWASLVNLNSLARIDSRKREVVSSAARTLERLHTRTQELSDACASAKPRDLKFVGMEEVDEEKMYASSYSNDDDDEDGSEKDDPTASPTFTIHTCLHSIASQLSTLKRLTRSLQEASPDAKDEVVAISSLVDEVTMYFGSQSRLDKYAVDERLDGGRALEGVRSGVY